MATYSEVQDLILGDLHRVDLTTQVIAAMSNAVAKLKYERYWFNEFQTSFTATLTCNYDLQTYLPQLLQVDELRCWMNSAVTRLDRAHWTDLAESDEVLVTGRPAYWAIHHEVLRLHPTPNAECGIDVIGLRELSVTAWCSYAPTLLRATAEVELYALVTHDMEGALRAAEYAKAEKLALLRHDGGMAASGEVRGHL